MSSDSQSIAHASWNCKCRIVFVPKCWRKGFYGLKRLQIGAMLREFWCRGCYADTVGKNTRKIAEYIRHQLEEGKAVAQLTIDFDGDRLTGKHTE